MHWMLVFEIDVHGGDSAVGCHDGVELFGLCIRAFYDCGSIVRQSSEFGCVNFAAHNSQKAV